MPGLGSQRNGSDESVPSVPPPAGPWRPVSFTSYRGDDIPDGLQRGDWVRARPNSTERQLASPTNNGSWQDTNGQIVPIRPGWQFLRPDQQEAAA